MTQYAHSTEVQNLLSKTEKWSESYNKLALRIIEKAKDSYYNSDKPTLPDYLFDQLVERYEKETGLKIKSGSSVREGLISFDHVVDNFLGTLDKIKHNDADELTRFLIKLLKANHNKEIMLALSQKIDGNSLAFSFQLSTGKLRHVFTRGEEGKGLDLTEHFLQVGGFDIEPIELLGENIDSSDLITFKFEACCFWDKFATVEGYKNPRNYVSGQLGRLDLYNVLRQDLIDFVMLGDAKLSTGEEIAFEDFEEIFNNHPKYKFNKRHIVTVNNTNLGKKINEILEYGERIFNAKNNYTSEVSNVVYNVMTDGMVIECLDVHLRESLGWTSDYPNYARAYKFKPMEAITTLLDIRFDFGAATSRYTPVALFEPVILNGNTYENVSLANYARFMELQPLGKGSKVLFTLVNDTLGYLDKLDVPENESIKPIPFIGECKYCGHDLHVNDNETFVYCINKNCEGTLSGRIFTYLEKIGVKNIGKATVDLISAHLNVTYPHELYLLTKEQLASLPRMGDKSAENFLKEISLVKVVKDYDFFNGAAVEGIGSDTFRKLFSVISAETLMELGYDHKKLEFVKAIKTAKPEDIADKTIQKLYDFFSDHYNYENYIIPLLCTLEVIPTPIKVKDDNFKALTFCVTGSTKRYPRKVLIDMLKEMGHKVTGEVTSKTDYLINNDINSSSGKNRDAKTLGKPIISEEELYNLLKF